MVTILETDLRLRIGANDGQWAVISAPEGHLLVNAAAGTGKTTALAGRLLYLQLVRGLSPVNILALTFSRSARGHFTSKLSRLVSTIGAGSLVRTFTFHGLAYRVLDLAVGMGCTWLRPGFDVFTTARGGLNPVFAEGGDLFRGVRDDLEDDVRLELYARAIDILRHGHPDWSDSLVSPEELDDGEVRVPFGHGTGCPLEGADIRRVWRAYQSRLEAANCIDYPGMVAEALHLLETCPEVGERAREGLRHVAVDEYQDTSRAQAALLQSLASRTAAVTAVGDPDQTIYSFNGSHPGNMTSFTTEMKGNNHPVLPVITLNHNYRSTPNILGCGNRLLAATGSPAEKLSAAADVAEPVPSYRAANPLVVRIHSRRRAAGARWIAGEVRRLVQEEGVRPDEIAILVRKDTEHYPQGAEVRLALEEAGLTVCTRDRDPQRTQATLEVARQICAREFAEPLEGIARSVRQGEHADYLTHTSAEEVLGILEEARLAGAAQGLDAHEILCDRGAPEDSPPGVAGAQVRTVHSAKGLEFRVVFVTFLAEREFPSGSHSDIEEERRLLYVAVTRAQERLYLVGCRSTSPGGDFFTDVDGSHATTVDLEAIPVRDVEYGEVAPRERLIIKEARKGYRAAIARQTLAGDDDPEEEDCP